MTTRSDKTISIAFVVPFGSKGGDYFPDALAGLLCARARGLGHRAAIARVYYDGTDAAKDAAIRARLGAWLAEAAADLIVVERLFDPAPITAHLAAFPRARAVYVTRGDELGEAHEPISWAIGASSTPTRAGHRRTPETGEIVRSFEDLVDHVARGADPCGVPGVARIEGGRAVAGEPSRPAPLPRPFRAALDATIIADGDPPPARSKTIFGNAGCPYASDPLEAPHYRGLVLVDRAARLGCAFCNMGGDYQKRPDGEVVGELIEQARFYAEGVPELEELVLSAQHALRYLPGLLSAARGMRPLRWLFPARADAFVRERERIERAIDVARDTGHRLEVYLSGFEAFSDRELERYHKGVSARELVRAVEAMRELHAAHPDVFDYARARGHSLILFNPWTSPEDLGESVEAMRAHGLCELFDELGRNRLRLYEGLPITAAAERDGAIASAWEQGGEGAARRKGYPTERPWRFLDRRTALARELSEGLRERLGGATELAQLAAAVRYARAHEGPAAQVLEAVERLRALLASRTAGAHHAAAVVPFAGACNNGCETCSNRDRWLDDREAALLSRVDEARRRGLPISLAGREPALHAAFALVLARARGADRREVAVVTNGRRFAYARFAAASVRAGLSAASVKLFGPDAETADAIARVEGAFAQAVEGVIALGHAGASALEVRVPVHARTLDRLERYVPLASRLGASALFVEVALDALGLENARRAVDDVATLIAKCDAAGLAIETAPLASGTARFDRLPAAGPRR